MPIAVSAMPATAACPWSVCVFWPTVGSARPKTTVRMPAIRSGDCVLPRMQHVNSADHTVTDEKMMPKIAEPATSRPIVVPTVPR